MTYVSFQIDEQEAGKVKEIMTYHRWSFRKTCKFIFLEKLEEIKTNDE